MAYSFIRINSFQGGLNTKDDPMAIGIDQAKILDNWDISSGGRITKRAGAKYSGTITAGMGPLSGPGYHAITAPAGYGGDGINKGVRNITRYYKYLTTGSARMSGATILWALRGSWIDMFRFTNTAAGTNNLYILITQVTGSANLQTNADINHVVYRNILFFCDGKTKMRWYTGPAANDMFYETSGSIGNPTFLYPAVADDRIWGMGNRSAPNNVWFTEPLAYNTSPSTSMLWSHTGITTNTIAIPERDSGDIIVGSRSFYNDIYAFRQNDIWVVAGTNYYDFELRRVVDRIGAIDHKAIEVTEDAMYFVHRSGAYRMYPGGRIEYISAKISDLFENNPEYFVRARLKYYPKKRQLWLWYDPRELGYNNAKLVYYIDFDSWSRHTHDFASCAMIQDGETDNGEIYLGHPQADAIIRADIGFTGLGGEAIPAVYESGDLHLDQPEMRKMARHVFVQLQTPATASINLVVYTNRGEDNYRASAVVAPLRDAWGPGGGFWGDDYEPGFIWGGTINQDIVFPLEDYLTGEYLRFRLFVGSGEDITVSSIMPRVMARTIRLQKGVRQ